MVTLPMQITAEVRGKSDYHSIFLMNMIELLNIDHIFPVWIRLTIRYRT
jgi:hypothetical protein